MKHIPNVVKLWGVVALVLCALSLNAHAQDIDCDAGGNLQAQIDSGDNFVTFTGTCNQGIIIFRDGVTLDGLGSGVIVPGASAAGQPGFLVVGATRVRVQNLTISNGGFVTIINGAYVDFNNVTINTPFQGFNVLRGSDLRIVGSTIAMGTVDPNISCGGLCILENSGLRMNTTTITANTSSFGNAPLEILRGASATLRGGNTISNSGSGVAIIVTQNSDLRSDDPSKSGFPQNGDGIDRINGTTALLVSSRGFASLRSTQLTGKVNVQIASTLIFAGQFGSNPAVTGVDGDITVAMASQLIVTDPKITIDGAINCADTESSLNTTDFVGNHTIDCTGFGRFKRAHFKKKH